MKKRQLKYLMIGAVLSGATVAVKKVLDKSQHVERIIIDFTGDYESNGWNPLDAVDESPDKAKAAKTISSLLLQLASNDNRQFGKAEKTLLASVILYVNKTNDNTLMHVCNVLSEMASIGDEFDYDTLPAIINSQWDTFKSMPYKTRQNIIENILIALENYDIETYADILEGGDIRFSDFLKGNYEITLIEHEERPLLASLFEHMLIAFEGL